MRKKLLLYIINGIACGCVCFVIFCLGFYFSGNKTALINIIENLPAQVLGSILVGIGFTTTSIVYAIESMSFWRQTLIHYVCGVGTFFLVAYFLKWIEFESPIQLIASFLAVTVVFLLIWGAFLLYYRQLAKKMNEQLKKANNADEEP